jgi:hypothetical protein
MKQVNTAVAVLLYSGVCRDASTLAVALKDIVGAVHERKVLLDDAIETLEKFLDDEATELDLPYTPAADALA